jgi:hypothetical protein
MGKAELRVSLFSLFETAGDDQLKGETASSSREAWTKKGLGIK